MKTLLLTLLLVPMMSFGQNNYSMSFDGVDDAIDCGYNMHLTNSLSLAIWFKTSDNSSQRLISNSDNCSMNRYFLMIDNSPSVPKLKFNINYDGPSQTPTGAGQEISYFFPVNNNLWHFAVGTWDGNTMKLYLDGILVDYITNINGPITYSNNTSSTYIANDFCNAEPFYGLIDESSIWNIALTEQEIQQYMNCPPTGNETGLVGYWNFEEGSGTTALDLASNGNDGTINGATYNSDVPVQNCCTPTSSTDVQTACESYTWIDGNTYTTSNNTATYTTTNAAGCDSVITIDLTIDPLPSAAVTQNGATLTATQTGATYQWIDCDDESNIVGETNQSFTPAVTGNYAVIVNVNGCSNTSECRLVDFTGINELNNTLKQLIKIVDVLGRETPFKPNTPLLYIYNDGTVERKMIIE